MRSWLDTDRGGRALAEIHADITATACLVRAVRNREVPMTEENADTWCLRLEQKHTEVKVLERRLGELYEEKRRALAGARRSAGPRPAPWPPGSRVAA